MKRSVCPDSVLMHDCKYGQSVPKVWTKSHGSHHLLLSNYAGQRKLKAKVREALSKRKKNRQRPLSVARLNLNRGFWHEASALLVGASNSCWFLDPSCHLSYILSWFIPIPKDDLLIVLSLSPTTSPPQTRQNFGHVQQPKARLEFHERAR
jgi:hypothetical protein